MPLQIRRGTESERQLLGTQQVPGLEVGEPVFITDTNKLYIGNTGAPQGIAVTGFTETEAKDAVGSAFADGTHDVISFSYDNDNFSMSTSVDLGDYTGNLNLNLLLTDLIPEQDETFDLGSSELRFNDIYAANSIIIGNSAITESEPGTLSLPLGTTVNGDELVKLTNGNLSYSIVGEDSSVIVDIVTNTFQGNFVGDLFGNVIGEDSSIIINAASGIISGSGVTIDENNIFSTNGDALNFYRTFNGEIIAGAKQLVNFPVVATPTVGGDILTTIDESNYIGFTATTDLFSSTVDLEGGEIIGSFSFNGKQVNGTESGAVIGAQVDPAGTTTPFWIPSKLFFGNTPATEAQGDNPPLMTFDSLGRLAVNQQNAEATVDINGFMKLAILDAEPANPSNGMIAIADGDEWDPLSNGKQSMVVRLGGAWVQIAAAA